MKTAKKIFKIVGIILGIIILALIGYIIYLFASYHRIEDNLPLEVESHAADAELTTEKEYSALTYNIGFGASMIIPRMIPTILKIFFAVFICFVLSSW